MNTYEVSILRDLLSGDTATVTCGGQSFSGPAGQLRDLLVSPAEAHQQREAARTAEKTASTTATMMRKFPI